MHRSFTQQNAAQKKGSAFLSKALLVLLLLFSQSVLLYAHTVDHFTSCRYICEGSKVTMDAKVSNTRSNTNYNWQFRDNSNVWKCFVNGNNTVNGAVFSVSGATAYGLRTTAPTLTITSAKYELNGVELRMVMADGNNVSPCASNPAYPVYGTDKKIELKVLRGNECNDLAIYCSGGTPGNLKLGNLVFNDINANGIKNADEPGVGGVTVKLYVDENNNNIPDGAEVPIATTTTAANGSYLFSGLKPGNYVVGVVIPEGYIPGPGIGKNNDPDNNIDYDGNEKTLLDNESEERSMSITLSSGNEPDVNVDGDDKNSNLTLDLAICGRTDIGDFVWKDLNCNGIQNSNEPGLANVTVKLTYPDGTTRTTLTDANGKYKFINLGPGNHTVQFVTPTGYTPAAANQGNDDAADSDPVDGKVTVLVKNNKDDLTIDAGYCPYTPPIPGCPDAVKSEGFENGSFSGGGRSDLYNGLPRNGSYQVVQDVDDLGGGGYQDIKGRTGKYFLAAHTSNDENDRIYYTTVPVTPGKTYSFCAYVTLLKNLGQGAEFYIGLYVNGNQIGTQRVNFDWKQVCGTYTAKPGETSIEFSIRDPKKGLFFVAIDDICIVPTHTPQPKVLCLGNQVWNDRDGDGKRDLNEPGIPGATISLYTDNDNNNLPDGAAIKTTVSDANGKYQFSELAEGRYIASMPILPGYQKSPNSSTQLTSPFPDNNIDNDNNLVRLVGPNAPGGILYSNAITLTAGQEPTDDGDGANCNQTFDLAECGNSYIGDFVWNDLDGDGIQDAGEPGINGVLVTLTFPDGTIATEETHTYNAPNNQNSPQFDGYYDFENLGPGTYTVKFTKPAGFNPSPANQGGNDAKDSDPVNEGPVTVTLAANQSNFTIDAGFTKYTPPVANLRLGNQVWNDRDGDGKRDLGEPAIPGAPISLYTDNNSDNLPDGPAIRTTTSDAQGKYLFTDLLPGRYIASMPILPGYQKSPNSATQDISPFPDLDVDDVNKLVRLVGPNGPGGVIYTNAITLAAGTEPTTDGDDANGNLTFDLAECGTLFIGDFVWNDLNGNGIQDAGEPGLNGVLVTITFSDGRSATEETHTYNAANNQNSPQFDGYYDFENLGPGTYKITFTKPAGFQPSPANQGNDAKDSDPVNEGPVTVTLTTESNFTIDAGFTKYTPPVANLKLGNQVWNDRDGDGKRDLNEPAIPGAPISLYTDNNSDNLPDGPAIRTTTSDAQGRYLFSDLLPGRYIASMPILPGYQQSPNTSTQDISPFPDLDVDDVNKLVRLVGPNGPGGVVYTNAITLAPGTEPTTDGDDANGNLTFDLAECGNSFIGDFVWNDLNGNGIQEAGEPGINGVLVTITFPDGRTATETTQTYNAANNQNAPQYDGYYDFKNLGPGTYTITFATPAGLNPSPANQGGNDAKDSDPVNGAPVSVTIAANQSDFTIDAGFTSYVPPVKCPNLSLGNYIYKDLNGNCKKDYYEFGIDGVTVNLYMDADGNNTPDGAAIATVETSEDGTYLFTNLAEGKYVVGVKLKDGYTMAGNGSTNPDNNVDNDNNGVRVVNGEVRSNAITLSAGTEPINDGSDNNSNNTLDFGFKWDFSHDDDDHHWRGDNGVSSSNDPKPTLGVFPNPAGNNFTLNVHSIKEGIATVRIMDAAGKVYVTTTKSVTFGSNMITFNNVTQLKSGTYNVQMILNGHVLNQKLVVSK